MNHNTEIKFDRDINTKLLNDLSNKMSEINRGRTNGRLIREVEIPNQSRSLHDSESFELYDGMSRIISSENLESLRELGKVYLTVGWIPSGLVTRNRDRYEVELTFEQSKSSFNL